MSDKQDRQDTRSTHGGRRRGETGNRRNGESARNDGTAGRQAEDVSGESVSGEWGKCRLGELLAEAGAGDAQHDDPDPQQR